MIIQEELLQRLKDLGLNSYESKLWVAILSRGVSSAGELSDIANVPRSRTYDVLESLEKKGFIMMKLGKPIKYIAVQPEEVMERVQKKITIDAQKQVNLISSLKESTLISELGTLYAQGIDLVNTDKLTASLKGRQAIYDHMSSMVRRASNSVILSCSGDGLSRKLDFLGDLFTLAKERGADVKVMCNGSVPKNKSTFEIKKSKSYFGRFLVVDKNEVLFMLLDDVNVHQSYDTGIWAQSPVFAQGLSQMFETAWKGIKE